MSASALRSSKAEVTVVPDVPMTASGTAPVAFDLAIAVSSAAGMIEPTESDSTFTTLSIPIPNKAADLVVA